MIKLFWMTTWELLEGMLNLVRLFCIERSWLNNRVFYSTSSSSWEGPITVDVALSHFTQISNISSLSTPLSLSLSVTHSREWLISWRTNNTSNLTPAFITNSLHKDLIQIKTSVLMKSSPHFLLISSPFANALALGTDF